MGDMEKLRIEIKNMEDLSGNLKNLPTAAIADIDKRITDWIASGGDFKDGYIKQQFRYAENIINARRRHEYDHKDQHTKRRRIKSGSNDIDQ